MAEPKTITPFTDIYDIFFSKITDDYYMEATEEDVKASAEDLLVQAVPWFEFPRTSLEYYKEGDVNEDGEVVQDGYFTHPLTSEEKNIIATYMVAEWMGQQLASVELTRMKYSGADFKFTSQANHLQKLNQLRQQYITQGFHLQRLYKRRVVDKNGVPHSSLSKIVEPEDSKPRDTSLYPDPNKAKKW